MSTAYKGHTIYQSSTTTGGNNGNPVRHVYEIAGPHGKGACVRPFLTSTAQCREYINDKLFWSSPEGAAELQRQQRDSKR